jgi:hypothetical protein
MASLLISHTKQNGATKQLNKTNIRRGADKHQTNSSKQRTSINRSKSCIFSNLAQSNADLPLWGAEEASTALQNKQNKFNCDSQFCRAKLQVHISRCGKFTRETTGIFTISRLLLKVRRTKL